MTKVVHLLAVLAVLAAAPSAAARERLAVFIAVEGEPALAENLAEVTIAKLAERGEFELVGAQELEATSREIPSVRNDGLAACVELPACLADVGRRARAQRAVLGKVRRNDTGYEVELTLVHTETFQTDARQSEKASADLEALIAALQTAAAALVRPSAPVENEARTSEPPALATTPGPRTANAAEPSVLAKTPTKPGVEADSPATGPSWQTIAGFTAAGLAVIAFSAGAVMAVASDSPPSGTTRAEREADVAHRKAQAKAANALFVTGGVFSVAAVVSFVWP